MKQLTFLKYHLPSMKESIIQCLIVNNLIEAFAMKCHSDLVYNLMMERVFAVAGKLNQCANLGQSMNNKSYCPRTFHCAYDG